MDERRQHTLSPEDWNAVKQLFDQCQPLSHTERLSLLARATRNKPWIRAELESLLSDEEGPINESIRSQLINLSQTTGITSITNVTKVNDRAQLLKSKFVPEQAGKYLLLERLGVGGMAEVFRAKLKGAGGFEKYLAVKRVLPAFGADEDFRTLFEFEAKLSSQLSHANIVQVHDFVGYAGSYLLAMEYVSGKNLKEALEKMAQTQVALPIDCCVFIINEVCKGLEYAHARSDDRTGRPLHIIHRDISPKNIMVSYQGEVKIVDFGIAKARDRANLTDWGGLRGTLSYMSPEQVSGLAMDHRSDLFSTGAVFYELLSGQPLFPIIHGTLTMLQKIEECELPQESVSQLDVPDELKEILFKALAKDPAHRYQSAGQFQTDLQQYLNLQCDPRVQKKLSDLANKLFSNEISHERSLLRQEEVVISEPRKKPRAAPIELEEVVPPIPSSSSGLIVGIFFLAAVLGFGSYLYLERRRGGEKETEPRIPAAVAAPVVSVAPAATPKVEEPEVGCQAAIESTPPGAKVSMNGILVGRTPTSANLTCDSPVTLKLELTGYETFSRDIAVKKKSSRLQVSLSPEKKP